MQHSFQALKGTLKIKSSFAETEGCLIPTLHMPVQTPEHILKSSERLKESKAGTREIRNMDGKL